jgi:hypothetical protein
VQAQLEFFYQSAAVNKIPNYPIKFVQIPTEVATIQSSGGQVLLANAGANTKETPGTYTIINLVSGTDDAGGLSSANYRISLHVEGFWR